MGIERLTKLCDESYLDEPLEIELARAERYGRELGFILLQPYFQGLAPGLSYDALKKLAVVVLARTRKVDVRVRWKNAVLLILPETPREGLEVVVGKIEEQFAELEFESLSSELPTRGALRSAVLTYTEFDAETSRFPGNVEKRKLLLDFLTQRLQDATPSIHP